MKIEEHEKAYQEHLKSINKFIEEGIEENQRNIGYNVSQGSVELLSIFLHKLNLLQAGDQLDHRVFKNKSLIEKRIPPEFPEKARILEAMKIIELERNVICYGTRKPRIRIEKIIALFNELRNIINKNLNNPKNDREK